VSHSAKNPDSGEQEHSALDLGRVASERVVKHRQSEKRWQDKVAPLALPAS
jgi:hypothetical protein